MYKKIFKPVLDIILSAVLLVTFSPLFIIISIIIWAETKRFPLFKQLRGLTHNNKVLHIYKFRTLVDCNSSLLKSFSSSGLKREHLQEQLTNSGKLLRKTGLDELPQLFNVFKGEMSLIGPRPLVMEDLEFIRKHYPEVYKIRESLELKSGITGLWQLNRDSSFSIESLSYWDSFYQNNLTFFNDFRILLKTIYVILFSKHKDAIIPENRLRLSLSLTVLLLYFFSLTLTVSLILK